MYKTSTERRNPMSYLISFYMSVMASVIAHMVKKWIDNN